MCGLSRRQFPRWLVIGLVVSLALSGACQPVQPLPSTTVTPVLPARDPAAVAAMQAGLTAYASALRAVPDPSASQSAVAYFDDALAREPEWAEIYICRAYAAAVPRYLGLTPTPVDAPVDAAADLARALRLVPASADAYLARAVLNLYARGSPYSTHTADMNAEALLTTLQVVQADLTYAVALAPTRTDAQALLHLVNLVVAALTGPGMMDVALAEWEQLQALYEADPVQIGPYYGLVILAASATGVLLQPEWPQARLAEAEAALMRDPKDGMAHLVRGLLHFTSSTDRELQNQGLEDLVAYYNSVLEADEFNAPMGQTCAQEMLQITSRETLASLVEALVIVLIMF